MRYALLSLLLILSIGLSGQSSTSPFSYEINYFPFQDDIQMIEIVFGLSDLSMLGTSQILNVSPNPPAYIFRDPEGTILTSYNLCDYDVNHFELKHPRKVKKSEWKTHRETHYPIFKNWQKAGTIPYANVLLSQAFWGCVDQKGKVIAEPIYRKLTVIPNSNLIAVVKGDRAGFLNANGEVFLAFDFDAEPYPYITLSTNPIILRRKGKFILINRAGEFIHQREYDHINSFWSYKARVKFKSKFGFVDTTGFEIIPPQYDYADDFYKDAVIVGKNNKFGIINSQGEIIQALKYDRIEIRPRGPDMQFMGYKGILNGQETLFDVNGKAITNDVNQLSIEGTNQGISLSPIKLGDLCICNDPVIVDQIQLNESGNKEVFILRKCKGSIGRHGGTFDITEEFLIEQYEVWDIDKQELLFKAIPYYSHRYQRFQAQAIPQRQVGNEGYAYDLSINPKGEITIKNVRGINKAPGSKFSNPNTQVDKKPGIYRFKRGEYRR